MSLLHHNDGGLRVTAAGVGLEVFLHRGGCSFLLILIGILPNPEEDLQRIQNLVILPGPQDSTQVHPGSAVKQRNQMTPPLVQAPSGLDFGK